MRYVFIFYIENDCLLFIEYINKTYVFYSRYVISYYKIPQIYIIYAQHLQTTSTIHVPTKEQTYQIK